MAVIKVCIVRHYISLGELILIARATVSHLFYGIARSHAAFFTDALSFMSLPPVGHLTVTFIGKNNY